MHKYYIWLLLCLPKWMTILKHFWKYNSLFYHSRSKIWVLIRGYWIGGGLLCKFSNCWPSIASGLQSHIYSLMTFNPSSRDRNSHQSRHGHRPLSGSQSPLHKKPLERHCFSKIYYLIIIIYKNINNKFTLNSKKWKIWVSRPQNLVGYVQ